MTLQVLRALFILLMAGIGWFFTVNDPEAAGPLLTGWAPVLLAVTLVLGVTVVCADILAPRRKLQVFAGVFFGLLVGMLLAFAFSFVTGFVVDLFMASPDSANRQPVVDFLNVIVGAVCCYFATSFILQTRDDFRFLIPYVELRRDVRGTSPIVLDTSVLIDGRIEQLAKLPLFEARLVVPRFVLRELQTLADERDPLKRARGRRGLDVLEALQEQTAPPLDIVIYDAHEQVDDQSLDVDQRLINVCTDLSGRLFTGDTALTKVAHVEKLPVLLLGELTAALRTDAVVGESLSVHVQKPGDQAGQGIGYLDDGTMVVIEAAADAVGEDVEAVVTNTRQTTAGTMVFAKRDG